MCNGNDIAPKNLALCDVGMQSATPASQNIAQASAPQLSHMSLPSLAEIQLQWDTSDMSFQSPGDIDPLTLYRMDTVNIRQERLSTWPELISIHSPILDIYHNIRSTGLPNCMGARLPLHSTINISVWETLAEHSDLNRVFLDMLCFGFPLQFTGSLLPESNPSNHSSALNYMSHIHQYIQKETAEGAILGPLSQYPFNGPVYSSPLMTRPKSGSSARRVIVDLSFPQGQGVNSQVMKGYIFGKHYNHFLPTIDQAVDLAVGLNYEVAVAVVDIERAYRNFRSDPLDWPLLEITVEDKFFVDLALPFCARIPSLYVQQLADFIVWVLKARGVRSLMYLDDLYLILPRNNSAQSTFSEVLAIIRSPGLPINYKKLIPPSTQVIWLGVTFDFKNNTLSIPPTKVQQLLQIIQKYTRSTHVPIKEIQSLIGRIAHVAKVVPAARIFMNALLSQLRDSDGHTVYINHSVLSDLSWFTTYFSQYNATSILPSNKAHIVIQADSSLTAGGAFSQTHWYTNQYPSKLAASHGICQLEAINYLVAVRTFVDDSCRGRTIEIVGDNAGALAALSSGRAVDGVLAAVNRAIWYHMSKIDARVVYTHRHGHQLIGADAMSRANSEIFWRSYLRICTLSVSVLQ